MKIKNLLGQSAFWMVNKSIAKIVGIEAALFLSYMIDKADTLTKKERDGMQWFYRTSEDIESETTLTYRVQKSCLKKLSDKGMMYAKLMGTPRKLYFTICESNILQNVNAIIDENATIELTKAQGIYNEEPITEKPKNKKPKNEYNDVVEITTQIDRDFETLIEVFNHVRKTNFKSTGGAAAGIKKNYIFWRQSYTNEEIETAIRNIPKDKFWKDRITPTVFFRQKNTNKESVDYIGQFLNMAKKNNPFV